jgi:hypothetical protein
MTVYGAEQHLGMRFGPGGTASASGEIHRHGTRNGKKFKLPAGTHGLDSNSEIEFLRWRSAVIPGRSQVGRAGGGERFRGLNETGCCARGRALSGPATVVI